MYRKPRSNTVQEREQLLEQRLRDLSPDSSGDSACDESFDYLNLPDDELKKDIIDEWRAELCTDRLKPKTCAVCAKDAIACDVNTVAASSIDLTLLRNDELPPKTWPTTYDFVAYERAILCSAGLSDTTTPVDMQICVDCQKALSRGVMPRLALANWLYYGREALPDAVREAFDSASIFERMLVSRVRLNSVSCRFKSAQYDPTQEETAEKNRLRDLRKGIRGNVIVTPLDVSRLHDVLPPSPEVIRDTMSVIFIGSVPPTRHTIKRLRPVLVRKSKVKIMLDFLMEHNPNYGRLAGFKGCDERNLNALFEGNGGDEEGRIPGSVYVGRISQNDAVDSATADYTRRNVEEVDEEGDAEPGEVLMENVGFTLGDESGDSFYDMKYIALKRCLAGKPFLGYRRGSGPVTDFDNPYLLSMAFPEEDPWGIGGILHPFRRQRVSPDEQVRHLLMVHGGRFQRNPEFAFFYYNVLRKQRVSRSMRYKGAKSSYKSVIDEMLDVDLTKLASLRDKCKRDALYTPVDAEEKHIMTLMGSVGLLAQQIPGSAGQKMTLRNEIRGMINFRGAPSLFITLNPSDVDNPIVRLFAGEDIVLEDLARGEDMDSWSRKILAAKNPASCALFFDLVMTKFISVILRHKRPGRGLFG
ncbi:hypothetical protein C8R43DRAFT_894366, partial [Mycena crocata]